MGVDRKLIHKELCEKCKRLIGNKDKPLDRGGFRYTFILFVMLFNVHTV